MIRMKNKDNRVKINITNGLCYFERVYGQLVLLPTRTESTCTLSLVNWYFFFGQLVLFSLVNSYFFKKLLTICYVSLLWHSLDL